MILVHDHGVPNAIVTVVEGPVHLIPNDAIAAPSPTVKEVATVELADVVDKKKP